MEGERDGADQSTESREPLFRRTYDWSSTTASMATLTALGTLEAVDPVKLSDVLGTTLHDHVDPEALDALVTGDNSISISFTIDEYEVRIDGDELEISKVENSMRTDRTYPDDSTDCTDSYG